MGLFRRRFPGALARRFPGPLTRRFRGAIAAIVAVALAAAFALACSAAARAAQRPRIVSLVPSLTEDLFAIGAGPQVVGTSEFTDFPPAAVRLPQVASSASIDAERILQLHPGEVVGIASQGRLVADLRRLGLPVTLVHDDSFDDIFGDLRILGRLSGHAAEAAALAARLRARTAALVHALRPTDRPRTFVVLGVAPIFTAGDGSYIAHLIALAGGINAAHDLRAPYGRYSAESLLALAPDAIVADAQSGLPGALARVPWSALRAVRDHRVYVLENADILERPGPRYNEGLAWLIARLHPAAGGKAP
jgi:iron complex transport system substrate-binding protein